MDTDTIADVVQPGETPVAPEAQPTSSTEPGVQPEPSQPAPTVVQNLDDLSPEQLDALLVQVEKGNVPVAPKTPEPAQTTEQPPPEQTPQDPEDPEAAPAKPESEPLHRLRLNKVPAEHRDLVKLARDMLAEGKSREEVGAAIAGQSAAPPAPAKPEAPTTTPNAKPSANQEAIATRIADLKAQQEQALNVDFDTAKAISLATEIAKLEMRQELEATFQTQQQQTEAERFVSAQLVHIEAVKEANPELLDEASPFYQEFADQKLLAEAKNDPVMEQPDWAVHIANRARQKIRPGTAAQPAEKPGTIPPPPPTMRPSGQLASGKPVPTISQTDVARALDNLTLDQADELLKRIK